MKRRRKVVTTMPWRVARCLWCHEDRDEEQLVEESRWCQYRGFATMHTQPATGAGQTEAVRQGVSRSFIRSDE